MADIKWKQGASLTTLLSTGLDGLANGLEAESAEFDNTSGLDLLADFEFAVCYGAAPSAGTKVAELYIEPAVDGSNYPSVTSGGLPQKALFIAAFESVLPSTSVVERLMVSGIPLPPLKLKFRLSNTSGQTYKDNTVAKTLKMQPYRLQVV